MSSVDGAGVETVEAKRHSPLVDFLLRLVKEKPLGAACGVVILLLLLTAIFADVLAPYGMNEINLRVMLEGASAEYWLGTDALGRDILSRLIYGARISVVVGLTATTLHLVIAVLIGVPTGFFGGKMDVVVQRFVDAVVVFPALLLLITVMSLVGQGLMQVIVVLGVLSGIYSSRVVKSAVIGIKENVYVSAAEAVGSSTVRTLVRHIMPNIMAPIIVIYTTTKGSIILTEAALGFLGYGLPPEIASWGSMLSGEGRKYMEIAPMLALWPGLALSIVIYSINMFGDALRDLLDPRLRGGQGGYGAAVKRKRGFLARLLSPFNW